MDAKQVAAAESLYRTATRLQRVGLIIDRTALSPAQRRAAFALQCLTASCPRRKRQNPGAPRSASPTRTRARAGGRSCRDLQKTLLRSR